MSRPLRVFIVDDDQDFAESLAILLQGEGHEVDVAFSGKAAIEKFREHDFDIAFMDVTLPGMNGVESLLEIRKFKPAARVVMMSGYTVEELLEQAVTSGALGVLRKPLDLEEVLRLLDEIKPGGILIVDDDADFVETTRAVLESRGNSVFVANTGEQAIESVRANDIDILVLDLRLPILSGLDTYLELRRLGHDLATIIVTAYADEEAERINVLRSSSVTSVLRKPIDPDDLVEAVEELSRSRRSRR